MPECDYPTLTKDGLAFEGAERASTFKGLLFGIHFVPRLLMSPHSQMRAAFFKDPRGYKRVNRVWESVRRAIRPLLHRY